MKKILFNIILITTLAVSSWYANAADAVLECNNCSSYQYKQKAFTVIPPNVSYGNYDVYVADLPNGILKRYWVSLETDPAFPGGVFKFAVENTVENHYLSLFNDLHNSYNTLKGLTTEKKLFNIHQVRHTI